MSTHTHPSTATGGGHGAGGDHHAMMVADYWRRFWVCTVLTVPVLLLAPSLKSLIGLPMLAFPGQGYVLLGLGTVIYVYGGWPFFRGLVSELRSRTPGMMTLVAMAITVAYAYSVAVTFGLRGTDIFWELTTLIDVMLIGHWAEMRSVMGASRALEALVKLMPSEAHLVVEGGTRDVPVDELKAADRVLVKPGEKVPVDGRVEHGETSVNEAMLTGESKPVAKKPRDKVIGGSVNGEGAVEVVIEKTGADTYLAQVIQLVRSAQESRSRAQDVANRAAKWLTIIALSVGPGAFVIWLILGADLAFSIERGVTVMVISCPHALGLAVPLVVAISTALSATNGLLIRDRAAFERARTLQAIVFDKTGTLTEGRFGVSDVIPTNATEVTDIIRLAAAVESRSEHPIAAGIVNEATRRGLRVPDAESFHAIPGKGAEASVEGADIKVVSPGYLTEHDLRVDRSEIERLAAQGKTVVYVLRDRVVAGAIALGDIVRPESKEAIQKLKEMGIRCEMLTGDNRQVAEWVAGELGLDGYFAEVLPDQKSLKIKEIQDRGMTVAMVGDGVNDAPGLVQSDVGIAIGAGTDVAVESADIVLVRNDPRDVVTITKLARATYRKMVQNLIWGTGYNVIAIPLAAGVGIPLGIVIGPAVAAVIMAASAIVVAFNAQLLRLPS